MPGSGSRALDKELFNPSFAGEAAADRLRLGDTVTVLGRIDRVSRLGISLTDCEFAEPAAA